MTLQSQTKTASLLSTNSDNGGTIAWANPQNARSRDGAFSNITLSSTNSHELVWSDFGFSFDPFATLSGLEIVYGLIRVSDTVRAATVSSRYVIGSTSIGSLGMNYTSTAGGINAEVTEGSSTSNGDIVDGIAVLMNSDFGITTDLDGDSGFGSSVYRHYGLDLTVYYTDPVIATTSIDGVIDLIAPAPTRIGTNRIRTISVGGIRHFAFDSASGFTMRSSSNLVLGGMPLSVYENSSRDRAIAVYDVNGELDGPLSLSGSNLVYQGHRFSFLENSEHRVLRGLVSGEHSVSVSDYTVWQGVPISLNEFGDIICKKLTGTILETRRFSLGGVPLTAVLIGNDWAIAVSNI